MLNLAAIAVYLDYNISSYSSIVKIGANPALWKITATGQHHLLDVSAILISYFILLPVFYTNPKTKRAFAFIAWFANYFTLAIHEDYWFGSAYIHAFFTNIYFNPNWILRSEFFFPYTLTIIAFLLFSKYKVWAFPKYTIISVTLVYIFWVSIGFPVSIWYTGYTNDFLSLNVNYMEIASWMITIFVFLVEQIKYITEVVKESKLVAQQNLTLVRQTDKYINRPKP